MLKEVLIVEGKSDVAAVNRAVESDCIATGGFHFTRRMLQNIAAAYRRRGIIILTDPDSAGENIRNFFALKFGWKVVNCADKNFARSTTDIHADVLAIVERLLLLGKAD